MSAFVQVFGAHEKNKQTTHFLVPQQSNHIRTMSKGGEHYKAKNACCTFNMYDPFLGTLKLEQGLLAYGYSKNCMKMIYKLGTKMV